MCVYLCIYVYEKFMCVGNIYKGDDIVSLQISSWIWVHHPWPSDLIFGQQYISLLELLSHFNLGWLVTLLRQLVVPLGLRSFN